jgi:acyl-[acyl-carrier-protein] desaturase
MAPRPVLLSELEPVAEKLLNRHLASAKEWFPHELVPWSRGRDFVPGESWSPQDADLAGYDTSEASRSALYVNLLTEDNLPYYFNDIDRVFGEDGPWGEWTRRWTAEEGRHSIAIRDYLTVTRAIDPWELERARMVQVSGAQTPKPQSPAQGFCYLALQELATRVAHLNTGRMLGDPAGYAVMSRVAVDENLHFMFYRDLVTAGFEVDADTTMVALEDVIRNFEMPGTGIPGFDRHAKIIARAGIYDLAVHSERILQPLVHNTWRVAEITGLGDEGERARDKLLDRVERTRRLGVRMAERRGETALVGGSA